MSSAKVLLIEDSAVDAVLIQGLLANARGIAFDIQTADTLAGGLQLIERDGFDVILSDL
ncbi:MAG: response regulator [Planctomycetota bacterium]